MGKPGSADWEAIGRRLDSSPPHSLWRIYCDRLNQQWLAGHLDRRRFDSVLKTDAFDEAVGEGVVPVLQGVAQRVYVMDLSPSTCRGVTIRCSRLALVTCDVRRLPFRGESFGLVVSLSTLDHFESVSEIEGAARCLYRVLRPGGRLLMTLDNLSNPLVRLRNSMAPRVLEKSGLVPFPVGATLRPGQLRDLLERVGFQVEDLTTLMHVPRAPAVALAALLDRLGGASMRGLSVHAFLALELLSRFPTSRWTGNYIAVSCSKGGSTLPSK